MGEDVSVRDRTGLARSPNRDHPPRRPCVQAEPGPPAAWVGRRRSRPRGRTSPVSPQLHPTRAVNKKREAGKTRLPFRSHTENAEANLWTCLRVADGFQLCL